jgi:hypothetical protein
MLNATHIQVKVIVVLLLVGLASVCFSDDFFDVAEVIPFPNPAPPSRILSPFPPTINSPATTTPSIEQDSVPSLKLIFPVEPPLFIFVAKLGYYVAIGTTYDIAYIGGEYFIFSDGYWYRSDYYSGPLTRLERGKLPSLLSRHNLKDFHLFRKDEFRRYNSDREHYKGRLHSPVVRKDDSEDVKKDAHKP